MNSKDNIQSLLKKIPVQALLKNWQSRLSKDLPHRLGQLQSLLDKSQEARDPNTPEIRLSLDWAKKFWTYCQDTKVPLKQKMIPLLALLYLVFPFDAIFDPLPILGLSDDILVLLWAAGKGLQDFQSWEKNKKNKAFTRTEDIARE